MEAAIGVVLHSDGAVVVVLAGPQEAPLLVHRGRIALVGDGLPSQAYHAAVESQLDPVEASSLVERCADAAQATARRQLGGLLDEVRAAGHDPRTCRLVGEVRTLPPLDAILRSHPMLHTAEGQLARRALAEAAASLGLRVDHLSAATVATLGDPAVLRHLGRAAGAPWGADQKQAARAALAALPAAARPAAQ